MISDIINIVTSLPSQHVIYGMSIAVLCIAVAWVYGKCSQKKRLTIQTIGYLVIFNEVVFQIYMIYYESSQAPHYRLRCVTYQPFLFLFMLKSKHKDKLKTGSILQGLVDRYLHLSIKFNQR